MNAKFLAIMLILVPCVVDAAVRSANPRVSVNRVTAAAQRMPTMTTNISVGNTSVSVTPPADDNGGDSDSNGGSENDGGSDIVVDSKACHEAYQACMDDFCLLDESEGYRCACSSNIESSKNLILEIQNIQAEADKLYTEGVEREQLGAKAELVFGTSDKAKKSAEISGVSFYRWLNGTDEDGTVSGSLDEDTDIGDALFDMANEFCMSELEGCPDKIEKENALYRRKVVADCKSFNSYLADQKINAQANKRTAEAAVRQARLSMLGTTNKYNRGECLLAYRACIADKGGCGANFENCLAADLLNRRAHACENVLEQCMAVRADVLSDWEAESEYILSEAEKYADKYMRQTCLSQIQLCLEDGCSTSTNSACLEDVEVAAGVCPIIDECDAKIPGIRTVIENKLKYLRVRFCQNDVEACLKEKCGENFSGPECLGKTSSEITDLCPQTMFPACASETHFQTIVSSVMLQLDYQLMQGCINHFSEQLGRACGTDMACLPGSPRVMKLQELPEDEEGFAALRTEVLGEARSAVSTFMKDFEKDKQIAACKTSQKPAGEKDLSDAVFNTAKIIAEISTEKRYLRELENRIAELSREKDLEEAKQACLNTYKVEEPEEGKKNYSYIRSVSFEPSLRNCHVCRMQQVCEVGGESEGTGIAKGAAGGLSSGAAMGTMVNAGWGTAIGGIVGAVGGGLLGAMAADEKEFCQEIESCEDINM